MDELQTEENAHLDKHAKKEAKKEAQRSDAKARRRAELIRSSRIWVGSFLVLGLSVAGLIWMNAPKTDQPVLSTTEVADSDNVKGPADAKITLIEYSDFQCPACRQYSPVVSQIIEAYPDDVRLVYRHYPLDSIHAQAQEAAEASEAAGMQGKFFEFHDLLFDNQDAWPGTDSGAKEKFVEYAQQLGLDVDKFKQDMESSAVRDKVNNDYSSGNMSGVTGTPTFFMNGQKIQNPRGFDPFSVLIDAELLKIEASASDSAKIEEPASDDALIDEPPVEALESENAE